jgi:hypothetical protein
VEVGQQSASLAQHLERLAGERRAVEKDLRRKLEEAAQTNEALAARLAELEKPRGLKALWQRLRSLFARPKPAAPGEPAA